MKAFNLRPNMTLAEFSAIQNDLLEAGQSRIAAIYFRDAADYKHRIQRFWYTIEKDGITFEYTYNDSCGCHPQYAHDSHFYTFEQINDWGVIAI